MQNESEESDSFLLCVYDLIKSFFMFVINIFQLVCGMIYYVLERMLDEIVATEHMFLLMSNIYMFLCQFFFFTLCDLALIRPELKQKRGKVVSGLSTLLLYSIFAYFATKLRDTFQYPVDRIRGNSTRDFYFRIARVILEFCKAAILILCLREQGMQYQSDPLYSTITFLYYLCSEKIFIEAIIGIARFANFVRMDSLEHLYVPIALRCCSLTLTVVILAYLLSNGRHMTYAVLSCYFTLYLPIKELFWRYINPLIVERKTYASFKIATDKELLQWDDVCAVCLDHMSRAKITPCNHFFHPQCLRRCLQTSMQCPLCKTNLIQQ